MIDEILVGDALAILGQVARDKQHLGMLDQEAVGDAVHDLHTLAQQFAVGRKIVTMFATANRPRCSLIPCGA